MTWLLLGIGLFVLVHLSSSLLPDLHAGLKRRIGANAHRGLYAVTVLAGVALIVVGWHQTIPVAIYGPPSWGPMLTLPLMFIALYLLGASHAKTAVTRYIRHPQLAAIVVWAAAHLLANGDVRSLALFATLGVWGLAEMPLLNRRDGEWLRPQPSTAKKEWIGVSVTATVFLVLIALHRYYAGVSPLPAITG